jgi:hypothetical protein
MISSRSENVKPVFAAAGEAIEDMDESQERA